MLTWIGSVILPDGTQYPERGRVRFFPGNRCEVSGMNLASRIPWSVTLSEDALVADVMFDDWTMRDHLFIGTRCGIPVRHVVTTDGPIIRSTTTRLDTGLVIQTLWNQRTTVMDWCGSLVAAVDPATVMSGLQPVR